jgi:ferric enterobactin receptor
MSSYTNNQLVDNPVRFRVLKMDYTHPFQKDSKLEMGAKQASPPLTITWCFRKGTVIDPSRSTDFEYSENINAVYAVSRKNLKMGIQPRGLRAEQTIAKGKQCFG